MIRLLVATACLLTASAPAFAAPVEPVVQMRVRYSDLNLASPEGANRLERRIRNAAQDACYSGGRGLGTMSAERLCRREMEAGAHRQLAAAGLPASNVRIASAR